MSAPQKINNFVTGLEGRTACDRCVARGVGIGAAASATAILAALATTSDFGRTPGVCSVCGGEKAVSRSRSRGSSARVPSGVCRVGPPGSAAPMRSAPSEHPAPH